MQRALSAEGEGSAMGPRGPVRATAALTAASVL